MLQRLISTITLALLFVLGQLGAAAHEISHINDLVPHHQKQDKTPLSQDCELCFSYAALGGTLASHGLTTQVFTGSYEPFVFCFRTYFKLSPLTFQARAPPIPA